MAGLEGFELYLGSNGEKLAGYDVLITDREADLATPTRVLCTFEFVPEELRPLVTIEKRPCLAIDWRRDSATLQHVSFDDVDLSEDPHSAADVTETRYRELGYEILADGPHGPLILEKSDGEALRVHLLFHPDHSTLVYRVGFPVMITNLVQSAMRRAQLSEVSSATTGVLPPIALPAGQKVRVEGPASFRHEGEVGSDGNLTGVPAPHVGEYSVGGGGEPIRVGAALLSSAETSLNGLDQIEFAEQLKVSAGTAAPKVDRSLWWPVACIALAVLALEWWWFNRRFVRA